LDLDTPILDRWRDAKVLLLGGSAGSFRILLLIMKILPPDLNKAVIVVIHRKSNYQSEIERLFAHSTVLPLREISDKDKICKNNIYLAPANYHTLIERNNYFGLDVSEAVWYSKPSIDVTFESAADVYKDKCVAILLSGANQDGAQGLLKLKNAGSLTIVQHPGDAEMPEMPEAAINTGAADYILTSDEIFELLQRVD
jgi:two-component system chemotaxis response regulator CheB